MFIWGKVFGAIIGFMFGRVVGAIFGCWLGHQFDRRRMISQYNNNIRNVQSVFFRSTFALLGNMAKATGRVTEADIQIASLLMDRLNLIGQSRIDAQQAFRDGKQASFDINQQLKEFATASRGQHALRRMFLEIQVQMALHDGDLHKNEMAILTSIASELGLMAQLKQIIANIQSEFSHHKASSQPHSMTVPEAYALLGVEESSSDQQIKRAYRKLMNENHPDKLVAKGLPEEMMALAKGKAQDIQSAYQLIKSERGMR
ncbi:co-chaperone DjlA [Shewanella intestini]|uniref:Co-chaperone protein DjlA n=1 Tax=Shewanella intestini TaxID=2017544 RepID=A0ABS5HXG6_9GAMM|nr:MULTISPECIES: co-chaperone DjlA [Shewanella]MBR9726413.1 co-chaperone DjlA [Shewanella intestini]MRG35021.1 co-chaperone DjlA [Shewanella sp. XMDDZSB0408]